MWQSCRDPGEISRVLCQEPGLIQLHGETHKKPGRSHGRTHTEVSLRPLRGLPGRGLHLLPPWRSEAGLLPGLPGASGAEQKSAYPVCSS
ncbi:hypothetical protein SKAU_G00175980 [Synaphobranchus kaupii]|uniref:Uncharacterized protein n=1 Tax=Synaphobranchus kaupii TaxID=118154 RepID=A0A9Q1FLA2_SYNKA|nr:hypothetical protein SKAU_G00175980 [Synaphobranchus kaupii]